MRRKLAVGTLALMALLAVAVVTWAQDAGPQAPAPGPGQHQFARGGEQRWGGGPGGARHFGPGAQGRFGRERFGERGGRGMGWQRGGMHRRFEGGGTGLLRMAGNPRVRQFLSLTDDQVARLHTIGVDAEKASVQNRADLQLRHIELRELMRADNPDQNAIMAKLDEVNALQGKIAKQRVQTLLSARSVLTPDQIKKLKTFMQNRGAMGMGGQGREQMMQHRPPRPGGRPGGPAAPAPGAKPATPPTQ